MWNTLFGSMETMQHEQLVFCQDEQLGLKAIICIHNTILGPALGGTRLWNYQSEEEAIGDALRLSRGMTYKNAISGLNLGGGKAVIIASPSMKSEAFWRRYGRFINRLDGKYITAEDVNTNTADMAYIAMETKHVAGMPRHSGGSGDPSPFTAYGVYVGMKAAVKEAYGNDSLTGKAVLVQGCGQVGKYLIKFLVRENAQVFVSDINKEKLKQITQKHSSVKVVNQKNIFDLNVDIYAPCALGATLHAGSINKLNAKVVAGAANNQLAVEGQDGALLQSRGILYAPDFVINAGGVINVAAELSGYNKMQVKSDIEKIYNRTREIFKISNKENVDTQTTAIKLAEERLNAISQIKSRR